MISSWLVVLSGVWMNHLYYHLALYKHRLISARVMSAALHPPWIAHFKELTWSHFLFLSFFFNRPSKIHVLKWDFPAAAIWIVNTILHESTNHSSGLMGYSWNSLVNEKSQQIINPIQYWNTWRDNKEKMGPVCSQLCYHIFGCLPLDKQVKRFVFQPWSASRKRKRKLRDRNATVTSLVFHGFLSKVTYEPLYCYLPLDETWDKVVGSKISNVRESNVFPDCKCGENRRWHEGNWREGGSSDS